MPHSIKSVLRSVVVTVSGSRYLCLRISLQCARARAPVHFEWSLSCLQKLKRINEMENRNSDELNQKKKKSWKTKTKAKKGHKTYTSFLHRREMWISSLFCLSLPWCPMPECVTVCLCECGDSGRYLAWISFSLLHSIVAHTILDSVCRSGVGCACRQLYYCISYIWFTLALSNFVAISLRCWLNVKTASTLPHLEPIFLLIIISVSCALLPSVFMHVLIVYTYKCIYVHIYPIINNNNSQCIKLAAQRAREPGRGTKKQSVRVKNLLHFILRVFFFFFCQCHFYVLSLRQPLLKTAYFFFAHACRWRTVRTLALA